MKTVRLLYGRGGLTVRVPDGASVLVGHNVPAVADSRGAVEEALARPIGSPGLGELVAARRPGTVAITISDITRPVPNKEFIPPILRVLNDSGIDDSRIVIIIGTGMHRPSTSGEREILLGDEITGRVEVIDHRADDPATLVDVRDDPPVRVNRRFVEADFRIVTGYIEPHFMAGFSGGRKGVCPALVDLATIRRFHGYDTLADPWADSGILEGNPCHEIALGVARAVGVDFLFNVALTRDRGIAGIYCGDLEAAHAAGCADVGEWTTVDIDGTFDLVVTCAGGFPLDQSFYQTVKGMCTAMPAAGEGSTLLQVSHCGQGIGSPSFTALMRRWGDDWRGYLAHLQANRDRTELDQWGFQVQFRVLERIGPDNVWFVTDGIPPADQAHLAVRPIVGEGGAQARAQRAIDDYLNDHPGARVAVIPDGPYTMLRGGEGI